jgi:poly(ADP-ribose) glycohydrolase
MDALHLRRNQSSQFKPGLMRREANKAYCGFMSSDVTPCGQLAAVATGNWGCGAFGGDKRLKVLLQWLAASAAGRDVVYFTFGDVNLQEDMHTLQQVLVERQVSVGAVWRALVTYHRQETHPSLYKYLLGQLSTCNSTSSQQSL